MKKLIYPVFIPMEGCPRRCIYCDQTRISGAGDAELAAQLDAARRFIQRHPDEPKEIAFYGGSFTALSPTRQTELAEAVLADADRQTSLRISTHPLYINADILDNCRKLRINCIELGIQDFSDEVLKASGRGYSSATAEKACQLVKQHGFVLGVQLMPGLPIVEASSGRLEVKLQDAASTVSANEVSSGRLEVKLQDEVSTVSNTEVSSGRLEDKLQDAASTLVNMRALKLLKPDYLRLYPLIVIKGTPLEQLYLQGNYQPLELEEAISICVDYAQLCEKEGITLIKTGLPSNLDPAEVVAGPWHPAFGEFVAAERLVRDILSALQAGYEIKLDKKQRALIMAHGGKYRAILEKRLENCSLHLPNGFSLG